MRMRKSTRDPGFTLIELMIVVSIIGILASFAIPSFIKYQMTSKRAEAYVNLASLAKTQKTYFAEFNTFVASAPEPSATSMEDPGTDKRDNTALSNAFSNLGWSAEGRVFFDYDTAIDGFAGCSCSTCFTSTAYGDLDGDMTMSEFVYFHPDQAGGFCKVAVSGKLPPVDPVTGDTQWDMVVLHPFADRF
jgi:prepilin-type N-terminal cleavage/methylation domain-containing protein